MNTFTLGLLYFVLRVRFWKPDTHSSSEMAVIGFLVFGVILTACHLVD